MPKELEIGFYIAIGLIAFFLYKKKAPLPTKLDLSGFKKQAKLKSLGQIRKVKAEVVDDAPEFNHAYVFMYQGKKYDALKVLAVPLGASKKEIKQAYASKLLTSPEEAELVVKAFEKLS